MDLIFLIMERRQIVDLLASISTHLNEVSPKERERVESLQQSLAEALLTQDKPIKDVSTNLFGRSLTRSVQIDKAAIHKIVDKAKPLKEKDQMQVEMRSSDFKANLFGQVKNEGFVESIVPSYAGARKAKTEGPFVVNNGIDLSFDFYPYLLKLNTLYIEGQALPALLFKTKSFRGPIKILDLPLLLRKSVLLEKENNYTILGRHRVQDVMEKREKGGPLKDEKVKPLRKSPKLEEEIIAKLFKHTRLYEIAGNTVWVRANLLSPSAPDGHYCGLRVKNGTVFLDKLPTKQGNNKITVNKTTTITVNLNLEQKDAEAGSDELFGLDAKNAEYQLPKSFSFSLRNTQKTILDVANIYCKAYETDYNLTYKNSQDVQYNPIISSIKIPVESRRKNFVVNRCDSGLVDIAGKAVLKRAYWALFSIPIDTKKPLEADGNGGLFFECVQGLSINIKNRDEVLSLSKPFIFLMPQAILIIDEKNNGQGLQQEVNLWKDHLKPFGATANIKYRKDSPLYYSSDPKGEENLLTTADLRLNVDRPVKVNGEPVNINTKQSILMLNGKENKRGITIMDYDVLTDNSAIKDPKYQTIEPIAFALRNALLTTTPPIAIILNGVYDQNFRQIIEAELITYFGGFSYLPTLPDPYVTSLRYLTETDLSDKPHAYRKEDIKFSLSNITTWKENEEVSTSFDFASSVDSKTKEQERITQDSEGSQNINKDKKESSLEHRAILHPLLPPASKIKEADLYNRIIPNKEIDEKPSEIKELIVEILRNVFNADRFSLLDVSGNANQLGISYKKYENSIQLANDGDPDGQWSFPFKIDKLDMVAQGINTQAFMLPQISWEPVFNLSEPAPPASYTDVNDPPQGFNYYPNDGIPTYLGNLSKTAVPLSPIPLSEYLVEVYKNGKDKIIYASFNLPFGMFGLSILDNRSGQDKKPTIKNVAPKFKENIKGGIQLELTAGNSLAAEGDLFQGMTFQLANVQDMAGQQNNYSTLGSSVHQIFSSEFSEMPSNPDDKTRPAVPLERIGLSGYGASTFSDWHNENATFAATSQATFNVAIGRTAQEVVQVKSVIYPWGIFVVRTITILRLSSGYIARLDSGWQAESDGKYYYGIKRKNKQEPELEPEQEPNPYEYHAGLVHGLYNIRNIRENDLKYDDKTLIKEGDMVFDAETNTEKKHTAASYNEEVKLKGLTFDADVDIEGVIEGQNSDTNLVPSKGMLGFVQLKPRGVAISAKALTGLLEFQGDSIGGPVNCTIKIADTDQYMKINRVDVNNSKNENNSEGESATPIFVVAARGSVVLPKEGSWTMVEHKVSDGTVTPLDTDMSVPLIRIGKWDFGKLLDASDKDNLQRIAHPIELLRKQIDPSTINFGFLQNLDTQKVLFLTPSFKKGINKLLSKTPPLLADGYRLLNSKGIFPNVGDAVVDFGETVQLLKGEIEGNIKEVYSKVDDIKDGAKEVYELLDIVSDVEVDTDKLLDQGYKLLKKGLDDEINKALNFEIPDLNYDLIDTENFKIRIDYKAGDNESKLDYNLDSFAEDLEDQWRGRLNNLSMVVSLGPFADLMTVQGNFNNEKGKESNFGGAVSLDAGALPTPKIEFSNAVEPVVHILEILQQLSTGDYKDALQKGLHVAMSNTASIWEYKYEAKKEIGLIQFPLGELYDSPQTPLKLEASLSLGFHFNAALKVTSNPEELLPTAGAFFIFHGGLQVMCVSIGGATIYAIGNVDLKLLADTSPVLAVDMKFGFGAQLAVGLPVIGNASLQFMTSIEIHVDTGDNVAITAIMMFRGHAELLGGAVGVTIVIEAKGAIEKSGSGPTNCRASVAFGLDISVAFFIDISFHEEWEETRQIA